MKPQIKADWLKALRSGKYQQGKARLQSRGLFCCLGILCDLLRPDLWATVGIGLRHNDHTDLPSELILEQAGLSQTVARQLAVMNDKGKTFNEIADFIEINL